MFLPRYVLLCRSFNDVVKFGNLNGFQTGHCECLHLENRFGCCIHYGKFLKDNVKTVNTARARTGGIFSAFLTQKDWRISQHTVQVFFFCPAGAITVNHVRNDYIMLLQTAPAGETWKESAVWAFRMSTETISCLWLTWMVKVFAPFDQHLVWAGIWGHYTVNLCLVIIKYKNTSWTNITVPQKYVFDFKE
jgi:hypothetical protein